MEAFEQTKYLLRRKIWQFLGQAFHIYDEHGRVMMYSKLKAFKLKEDIRVYTDETMSQELLTIHARSMLDFSATYDVLDGGTRQSLGSVRRSGLASTFGRDTWKIFDSQEQEIGEAVEDSMALALLVIAQVSSSRITNFDVGLPVLIQQGSTAAHASEVDSSEGLAENRDLVRYGELLLALGSGFEPRRLVRFGFVRILCFWLEPVAVS